MSQERSCPMHPSPPPGHAHRSGGLALRARVVASLRRARVTFALMLCALVLAPTTAQASGVSGDFDGDGTDDLVVGVATEDLGSGSSLISNAGAVNVIYGGGSSANRLTTDNNRIWTQNSSGIGGSPAEPDDRFGSALAIGDFDDDGYDDVAVGVPNEGAPAGTGAVHVIYGSNVGLTSFEHQYWYQSQVGGVSDAGDGFGSTLTAGNFDCRNGDDLAIGVPGENGGRGAVNVIYSAGIHGLGTYGSQVLSQGATVAGAPLTGLAEVGDAYGSSLAAGNFGSDAVNVCDDLAIGVPGEDSGEGLVSVLYGTSPFGLTGSNDQVWNQDSRPELWQHPAEAGDHFGSSLAAGDFNADNHDDLVVGVPDEDEDATSGIEANIGAVNVIYGAHDGLDNEGMEFYTQDSASIDPSTADAGDRFGSALTVADFDGEGHDDVAIGVPMEDGMGSVNVLFGGASGLWSSQQVWAQPVITGEGPQAGDAFGTALTSGDFNADGRQDLAIGAPGEDIGTITNAGTVNVIYGSPYLGLTTSGNQYWDQGPLADTAEPYDAFGLRLPT